MLFLQGVKIPEKITREEFTVMFEEMRKRFPQQQRPKSLSEKKD